MLRKNHPLLLALSPVHTSNNVAKNGNIVAETGNIVAVFGDNFAVFGDIVASVDRALLLPFVRFYRALLRGKAKWVDRAGGL